MDSFGIDRLALPKFGIDVLRLPNFGQTSNGASKGRFHESLVDAWFMSGYSNDNAPSGIRGVKGNVITLHNFLFAVNSGFGKYQVDFTNLFTAHAENKDYIVFTSDKIEIIDNLKSSFLNLNSKKEIPSFKIQVFGITNIYSLKYNYFDKDGNYITFNIHNDGIYVIQKSYLADSNNNVGFTVHDYKNSKGITITQIPDNEGALCFDGVDDYAVLQNTGFTVGTVMLGYYDYDKTSARWKYFYDANVVRTYAGLNGSQNFMAGSNNVDNTDKDGVIVVNYTKGTNMLSTPLYIGTKTELTEFIGMSLKYFAVYSEPLTTEQIEEEKVKLENKWESKLNKL